MALNFCVLYGSYREQREGIKAARYVTRFLKDLGYHATLIDAQEENLPLLAKRYMDYPKGQAPENLERLADLYRNADGFIVIAGEYNFSLQPGLKNMLDYFYHEYFHRPVGIASYSIGAFGGVRTGMDLRHILGALGMVSIPKTLVIPDIAKVFDDQGAAIDPSLFKRTQSFINEIGWYANALKAERLKGLPR